MVTLLEIVNPNIYGSLNFKCNFAGSYFPYLFPQIVNKSLNKKICFEMPTSNIAFALEVQRARDVRLYNFHTSHQ